LSLTYLYTSEAAQEAEVKPQIVISMSVFNRDTFGPMPSHLEWKSLALKPSLEP